MTRAITGALSLSIHACVADWHRRALPVGCHGDEGKSHEHMAGAGNMKMTRRRFLQLAGLAATLPACRARAFALDYPTRPVRIVAGFAAGGGVDITARLIGQWFADRLGQSFVTENRPGAGGNIGTEAVVNARRRRLHAAARRPCRMPSTPRSIEKLNFNFIRDIAPVGGIIRVPMIIMVHPTCRPKPFPS